MLDSIQIGSQYTTFVHGVADETSRLRHFEKKVLEQLDSGDMSNRAGITSVLGELSGLFDYWEEQISFKRSDYDDETGRIILQKAKELKAMLSFFREQYSKTPKFLVGRGVDERMVMEWYKQLLEYAEKIFVFVETITRIAL